MVPRKDERNYISVFKGSGCTSSVGRQGGVQKLKLGPNCASSVGVVVHELMHAVGNYENIAARFIIKSSYKIAKNINALI